MTALSQFMIHWGVRNASGSGINKVRHPELVPRGNVSVNTSKNLLDKLCHIRFLLTNVTGTEESSNNIYSNGKGERKKIADECKSSFAQCPSNLTPCISGNFLAISVRKLALIAEHKSPIICRRQKKKREKSRYNFV